MCVYINHETSRIYHIIYYDTEEETHRLEGAHRLEGTHWLEGDILARGGHTG